MYYVGGLSMYLVGTAPSKSSTECSDVCVSPSTCTLEVSAEAPSLFAGVSHLSPRSVEFNESISA